MESNRERPDEGKRALACHRQPQGSIVFLKRRMTANCGSQLAEIYGPLCTRFLPPVEPSAHPFYTFKSKLAAMEVTHHTAFL